MNHSGALFTHGWSGEHWRAKSRATSILFFAATLRKSSKSFIVPSSGLMASWPPSLLPIPHGTPGSVGSAVRELFLPFRCECPIGWIGGMYKTSKPIAATSGIRFAALWKVPDVMEPSTFLIAPSLRGKNSYQLPTSALSRSTLIG